MLRYSQLSHQHAEYRLLMTEIKQKSLRMTTREYAIEITMILAKLIGKIRLHLALEDERLYPALLSSGNDKAVQLASRARTEYGNLARDLKAFSQRWSRADELLKGQARFRVEANLLFGQIDERSAIEEREIFPVSQKVLC